MFVKLPEIGKDAVKGPVLGVKQYTPHLSKYQDAVKRLNEFFLPKRSFSYEHHVFYNMKQEKDEKINIFIMRLRTQAERCNFGEKLDENIKDKIIAKCTSSAMRRELLKQGDANLDEIIKVAHIFEAVAEQEKIFGDNDNTVKSTDEINNIEEVNRIEDRNRFAKRQNTNSMQAIECGRCGYKGHKASDDKCPAKGKTCSKCGGRDHFFKKCRSKKRAWNATPKQESEDRKDPDNSKGNGKKAKTEAVQNVSDEEVNYVFHIAAMEKINEVVCKIGGVNTNVIIDSGSKYNLLDKNMWKQLQAMKIIVSNQKKECGKVFKAYGGYQLTVLGSFKAEVEVNDKKMTTEFFVMEEAGKFLLGRDTAMALGILKIGFGVNAIDNEVVAKPFPKIKNVVVDIPVNEEVQPVIQPYRRIPIALEHIVDKKIQELEAQDIIEKVNKPSTWVSPVVVVEKGGKSGELNEKNLRVCIDMRRANQAVERENHPLPTIDDFLPQIGEGKLFSRLDISSAFHQV